METYAPDFSGPKFWLWAPAAAVVLLHSAKFKRLDDD